MTTLDRPDEARSWLEAAAAPGRKALRLAATCQALETVFTIVQWAGLAQVAQSVFGRGLRPGWPELGVLLAGGLLAAAAAWGAARSQAAGRRQISSAVRRRLVAALLPVGQQRGDPDAAT